MANIRSAAKRARQTEVRTAQNRAVKSQIKTYRKNVIDAITSGDKQAAEKNYRLFASAVDRASKTNLLHRNAAARQKSNLSIRLKAVK